MSLFTRVYQAYAALGNETAPSLNFTAIKYDYAPMNESAELAADADNFGGFADASAYDTEA